MPPRPTPRLLLIGALLLSLLPFLPFFADPARVLLYRDLSDGTLPNKILWLRGILEEGRIPRWTHLLSGGTPFLADPVAAPYYPLNVLFPLLGESRAPQALTLYIALHYPALLLGFYLLLRTLGHKRDTSLLLALTGSWCGFALSAHSMNHILAGVVAVPWFGAFWLRALKRGGILDSFAASFFLALPVYGGDPQFTYILTLVAGLHATLGRKFRTFATIAALAVLGSAAQLLPTLQLVMASSRASLPPDAWRGIWAIQPTRLFDFVFPNFFGSPEQGTFWGATFAGDGKLVFLLHSLYLGFAPVYLALWSIGSGWAVHRLRQRPRRWILLAGAAGLLLLAMERWAPVNIYGFAARWAPFWASFRYPERLAIYFIFAFYLLTAPAFRAHALSLRLMRGKSLIRSQAATLSLAVCLGLWCLRKYGSQPTAGIPQLQFLALSAGVTLFFPLCRWLKIKNISLLWLAITVLDLVPTHQKTVWFQHDSITRPDTWPSVGKILADRGKVPAASGLPHRLLTPAAFEIPWVERIRLGSLMTTTGYTVLARWEGMAGNIPSVFRISSMQGFFPLYLEESPKMFLALRDTHYPLLMDLFGVRYVLMRLPSAPPEVRLNEGALPDFFIPDAVEAVPNLRGVIARIRASKSQSLPTTMIESTEEFRQGAGRPSLLLSGQDSISTSLEITADRATERLFLVWNESFYPAWRAFVDGAPAKIRKANGWAMGVEMPPLTAGRHRLEFRFDETPIRAGQALTALWLLLLALAVWRRSFGEKADHRVRSEVPATD